MPGLRPELGRSGLGSLMGALLASASDRVGLQVVHETEDAKEGPRAFAEKQPPVWPGR